MKKLVILDLDQTLIHSLNKKSLVQESFQIKILETKERYYVHKRKHLTYFINELRKLILKYPQKFKVAIWTAAQRNYAEKIMNNIWPLWNNDILFLRSYSHCSQLPGGYILKDMMKLPQGYDTLLVDDNELHYNINTQNSFSVWKIKPFHYKMIDSELIDVLRYINDVIEKDLRFSIRPKTPNQLPIRGRAKRN
jgi:TFIIF-interacting CTD phosphatase-like protein